MAPVGLFVAGGDAGRELLDGIRFKSFMVELILAHLSDKGQKFGDYPAALEAFFDYIIDTELKERISFTDFYTASKLPASNGAVMEIATRP